MFRCGFGSPQYCHVQLHAGADSRHDSSAHFLPFKSAKLQKLGRCAVCLSIIGTLVLEGCAENIGVCFTHGNM